MKKIMFALLLTIVGLQGCKKDEESKVDEFKNSPREEAPDELLAPGDKLWRWGTVSSINYYDNNSSEYRNAFGLTVFFQFNKNGTYKFLLYSHMGSYGSVDQVWTEVEGTTTFGTHVLPDGKTYKTVTLHPVKGKDRIQRGEKNSVRALNAEDFNTRSMRDTYVFSPYIKDGKQFLDMYSLESKILTEFHEEW